MAITLNDFNISTATLIEQYKSQGYSDYITALKIALDEISLRILSTNGEWTKSKRQALKKLIEDEITKSYGGLFASMQDESEQIAKITFEGAMATLGLSAELPKGAIADLVNSNREIQGSYNIRTNQVKTYSFKDLFNVSDQQAKALKITFAGGLAQNKTPQQIVKDLKNAANIGARSLKQSVGTVIADSRSQAIYQSYEQIEKTGIDVYYQHDSTLDSNTSDVCRSLDGRKYFIPFSEIPQYLRPPIHIGPCRSVLLQKVRGEDYKGLRASAFGPVDTDLKYPQWLAQQSPKTQKILLGANRYKLYKEGKYKINTLPDMVGRKYGIDTFESKVKGLSED